ncbi:hypothetical protein PIGHUM_03937 [Pigmentiphaga humi]|uniref:DUF3300 domain-containing protein n=1 Tax=Pigmentiphaga humi TaxID=2478468 RepID=A0A3P4B6D2_9BURK|nr:DUF3300 domain-containing protein [Pigmentiphaga humi]VCU71847.1 hypothetical protein PIGHUM_03937 [Pigmentiphaga humi]
MASVSKIALCVAAAFATVAGMPISALAQATAVSTRSSSVAQTAELEQLVAPIALYPDALLSQVLMASTYPLEVVEAARWQKSHPDLQGAALEAALQGEDWDPSIKSLVAFPNVLDMMNDRLSWTSRLGDVFLVQQTELMDQVQVLRARAQAAGNLSSGAEQTVTVVPSRPSTVIRIEPTRPEYVYVPVYNPLAVYGPWLYPAYVPFYWYPSGYYGAGLVFSFGAGLVIGHALWGGYDWHSHRVNVVNVYNYNRFNGTRFSRVDWAHDPYHRRNVGYGMPAGPGRPFHADTGGRFAAREAFRPQADAWRRDLPRVDRATLRDRGGPGFGDRSFAGSPPARGGDRGASPGAWAGAGQGNDRPDRGGPGAGGSAPGGSRPGNAIGTGGRPDGGQPGSVRGADTPRWSGAGTPGMRGSERSPGTPSPGAGNWNGGRGSAPSGNFGGTRAESGAGRNWSGGMPQAQGGREFGGRMEGSRGGFRAGGGGGGSRGGSVGMAGGGGGGGGHHGGRVN